MALFYLLALWAGLRWLAAGRLPWAGAALLSAAAALLSKEMALSLPLVWLLLTAWLYLAHGLRSAG